MKMGSRAPAARWRRSKQGESSIVQRERACEGRLVHRRRSPVEHEFVYPVWMLLADVDRLRELDRVSRWLSVDRANVLSLRTGDYLRGPGALRERVECACKSEGVEPPR